MYWSVPSAARHSELVLVRAPAHVRRSTVDAEQDKSRLPDCAACQGVRGLLPDVGVAILRRSDYAVRVRCPVDGSDRLVMLEAG